MQATNVLAARPVMRSRAVATVAVASPETEAIAVAHLRYQRGSPLKVTVLF